MYKTFSIHASCSKHTKLSQIWQIIPCQTTSTKNSEPPSNSTRSISHCPLSSMHNSSLTFDTSLQALRSQIWAATLIAVRGIVARQYLGYTCKYLSIAVRLVPSRPEDIGLCAVPEWRKYTVCSRPWRHLQP